MTCPKCNRRLPPNAAQCVYSDCHTYFDKSALIFLQRDQVKDRNQKWAEEKRLAAEEKARKKAEREAKKAAAAAAKG
jgi:methionyl-tRNA synthetase